jgi:hypothetical protein
MKQFYNFINKKQLNSRYKNIQSNSVIRFKENVKMQI